MTLQEAVAFALVGLASLTLLWRAFRATLGPRTARWLISHGHLTLGRRLLVPSGCGQCVMTVRRTIVQDSRAR
jgi:hypothetical protein